MAALKILFLIAFAIGCAVTFVLLYPDVVTGWGDRIVDELIELIQRIKLLVDRAWLLH